MDEYRATFEIDSETDAYAVEQMMDQLYNTLREESQSIREESGDSTDMLAQFKAVRDAARRPTPGHLSVIYEQQNEGFEK